MKITLESTTKIVTVVGTPTGAVQARIWEGKTESGIPIHAYVTRIAVDRGVDTSEFDRELEEHRAPSPDVAAIPARLIL